MAVFFKHGAGAGVRRSPFIEAGAVAQAERADSVGPPPEDGPRVAEGPVWLLVAALRAGMPAVGPVGRGEHRREAMTEKVITASQASTGFSATLREVEHGESFVVRLRAGAPREDYRRWTWWSRTSFSFGMR